LIGESNRWVERVAEWIKADGLRTLTQRLGIRSDQLLYVSLFVLGRYSAHFSGHSNADARAVWTDWGHFQRERTLHPDASVGEMFDHLAREMARAKAIVPPESLMLPLPGLALVINPTTQPADM
jgi:hypothetical protein